MDPNAPNPQPQAQQPQATVPLSNVGPVPVGDQPAYDPHNHPGAAPTNPLTGHVPEVPQQQLPHLVVPAGRAPLFGANGAITYDGAVRVIRSGGSVIVNNRNYSRIEDLPAASEFARTDADRQQVRADLERQRAQIDAQLAGLNAQPPQPAAQAQAPAATDQQAAGAQQANAANQQQQPTAPAKVNGSKK